MIPKDTPLISYRSETGHAGNRMRVGEPRGVSDEKGRLPPLPEPTDEQRQMCMVLSANGNAIDVIAKVMRISERSLRKYCRQEIAEGRTHVKARIGAAVVREAMAGNVAAQRYWLVTHGGPEWQMPAGTYGFIPSDAPGGATNSNEVVRFYMPSNGRDQPEPDELARTIEGQLSKTGTDGA